MNNLNNKVFIATGSQDKFASAVNRLLPFKIKLIQKKLDIIEPQEEDIKKVTISKARQAYELLGKPVIVSDTGWSIPALKGFPGPFMHFITKWFTGEDLARLCKGIKNRTVIIENVAVYKDAIVEKCFISKRTGILVDIPKGKGVAIDQIASFRSDGKTIAQCQQHNLNRFDSNLLNSIWTQFGEWFTKSKDI